MNNNNPGIVETVCIIIMVIACIIGGFELFEMVTANNDVRDYDYDRMTVTCSYNPVTELYDGNCTVRYHDTER